MGKIKRYKNGIERFLSGEKGQIFFNFAYSMGAAIVILGALFKILHFTGGNTLLLIGMGTEVVMFVLTAFDRTSVHENPPSVTMVQGGSPSAGGDAMTASAVSRPAPASGSIISGPLTQGIDMSGIASEMAGFQDSMAKGHADYLEQMQALSRNIAALNTICEMQLRSMSSQLDASEQVGNGIRDIREINRRTADMSSRYCEETEKMAQHMQELNAVYERMLSAMSHRPPMV